MSFSLKAFFLAATFATISSAASMTGTISGTCGFYQGSPANVVYSENFSGNGTFCTGFMTGGYFTITDSIQVGDIFASTSHSVAGLAPTGYTEFATINTTLQTTQQYLFTPVVQPSTSTGTLYLSTAPSGVEVGSTGTCSEYASLNNLSTKTNGGSLMYSFTSGSPFLASITETANLTCNLVFAASTGGSGFTETGSASLSTTTPVVLDANGRYLGTATYQVITPEPTAALLVSALGFPFLLLSRRRKFLK